MKKPIYDRWINKDIVSKMFLRDKRKRFVLKIGVLFFAGSVFAMILSEFFPYFELTGFVLITIGMIIIGYSTKKSLSKKEYVVYFLFRIGKRIIDGYSFKEEKEVLLNDIKVLRRCLKWSDHQGDSFHYREVARLRASLINMLNKLEKDLNEKEYKDVLGNGQKIIDISRKIYNEESAEGINNYIKKEYRNDYPKNNSKKIFTWIFNRYCIAFGILIAFNVIGILLTMPKETLYMVNALAIIVPTVSYLVLKGRK